MVGIVLVKTRIEQRKEEEAQPGDETLQRANGSDSCQDDEDHCQVAGSMWVNRLNGNEGSRPGHADRTKRKIPTRSGSFRSSGPRPATSWRSTAELPTTEKMNTFRSIGRPSKLGLGLRRLL